MAINGTLELIQTVTVPSGGQAAIEFLNIPQTYDDLVIKMSLRSTRASTDDLVNINFNGVSTNQSSRWLQGNGSTASSGTYPSNLYMSWICAANNTASTFGNAEIYIPNYRRSANKSVSAESVLENNATTALIGVFAGTWSNSAAITSISLTSVFSANFVQHSTAYLYGVTRVPAGAKATGGVITDTDTHWIHTFTSTGVFTPSQNLTCDYLIVAGGGGGGAGHGGGGGAGGYRYFTSQSLTSGTSYTATVGAGGTGAVTGGSAAGTSGGNSTFNSLTSAGGGYGASRFVASSSGGSGGGGSFNSAGGAGNTPATSPVQGFAGGTGSATGAGGGGSSAVGANGGANLGDNAGNGGAGTSSSITGTSVAYAGGGGGGAYGGNGGTGQAGGGNGSKNGESAGFAASANSGSGGGGGAYDTVAAIQRPGGNGGSGIIIIRYAK